MKTSPQHKRLYSAIDKILWDDWDPIGINDTEEAEARDEYQSYTPTIFGLKIHNADIDKIAKKTI